MIAIEIKGKVNTALCYAKVVEDEAIEQIRRMCDYAMTEGSQIRIMPDVHAGKGCTIGTTMTITDKAVPNVVGVDIGCGMYTVNLGKDEIDFEKVDEAAAVRAQVVDFALQFVGNPYVYGGTDPNTGADCSGFTSYVLRHAAGVSLSHSSVAQAGEGRVVSEEEMKQGDLVFYSNGFRINHVAIYAGNGQVVHASTNKTGIKTSPWNYRTPVKIVRVLP